MFRPQSYFSNVPCPLLFGPGEDIRSRKCELVYCLFSHDVGDNAMSTPHLQAQQSHTLIQQQPQLLPQTHQELSSKLNNKFVHAQIHGGIRTPSGESVSSGSTGGVTLEEIELDLTSNTSDGNSSGSGSEDLRVARERGRERGIRVKRRKVDIGDDNDDDDDEDEDDNGVGGRIARGKKGSELLGKKKRIGDRRAGVGLQFEHEEEDSDEMEIEIEVEGVQLGKGDIPGLQEQHSKGKIPAPASTSTPTVASRGILQKQKQQIRDQQERMASVPGVTSTGGKPKSPAVKQSTTPQGKVDDGVGASAGFITRGMTTVPKAPPGSMISSSATTSPLSPALAYSTKPNSSTAAPGTVSKSTNTPTTTTTALAKPVLLVPAVVARCPAKWGTRQQLLTLLHGEYVRLYQATQQDPMVITMTVDEEAEIARTKGSVYPNVMKNRITALKKADVKSAEWVDKRKELAGKRKGELRKELEELAGVKNREVGAAGGKGQFSGLGASSSGVGRNPSMPTSAPPTRSETGTPTGTTTPKAASTPTPLVVHSDLITDPTLYKPVVTGLSPEEEIARLPPLLHPPATLIKYGHIIKPPSESDIAIAESGVAASLGWEICERCDSRFQIFPGRRESDGALASGGKCIFHWGRALLPPRSIASVGLGAAERTYTCCKESVGTSAGCVTGESHVFKVGDVKRLASQWQWVETYPSRNAQEGDPDALNGAKATAVPQVKITRAFGLDCEMCYTTLGMEMVRLTMVDFPGGKTVLDALVRPKGDILDLNSRFSGVSAKEYISAKPFSLTPFGNASTSLMIFPSPEAARDQVLQILRFGIEGAVARNPQADHMDIDDDLEVDQDKGVTALIGHALENDLSVLRLCHPYIIDTCILFPHSKGFPLRNKLAWIAERYLKWRIQAQDIVSVGEGGEGGLIKGHDSAIDARCAGELVRWRIKEGVAREKVGRGSAVGGSKGGRSLKTFGGGGGLRFDGVAGYIAREKEERDKQGENEKEVGVPLPHSQQQGVLPSSTSSPFNTTTSSSQLHGSNPAPGLSPQQSQSPRSQKQQQKRKRGVFTESDGEEGHGKDSKVTARSGEGIS